MLLGQKKRDWQVFYENEDNKDEPFQSEGMDKKTALDYLYIFDDAMYIQHIKTKNKIYKEKVENHLKSKSKDIYVEVSIMVIVGFVMGFILYEKILPSLIVALVIEIVTAIALIIGTAVDEIIGPEILKFKMLEEIQENEQNDDEIPQIKFKRKKSKDPGKIVLIT